MRALKWISFAGLAAVVLSTVDFGWAIGMVADRTGEMNRMEEAIYDISTAAICTGYGFAASFAFGPWGVLALAGVCTFGFIA